jgi:hypothetical protein
MHEPEKSDPVVVAAKPANNAESSAAEPVEPRTGTKGNASQQSTHRAQDRARVSQALERVRQAARQRKKEKFTSLLHHIDPVMLRTAFHAIRRDAAPGVDGETWVDYEKDLDRRIDVLHSNIHRGAYRALPSRRSYIPKEDGSKPARGHRSRRQDRPEGDGRAAERDLRGGVPRVLVRVPARAQPA